MNVMNQFTHTTMTVQVKKKYTREELHKEVTLYVCVCTLVYVHVLCSVYILWFFLQSLVSCFLHSWFLVSCMNI